MTSPNDPVVGKLFSSSKLIRSICMKRWEVVMRTLKTKRGSDDARFVHDLSITALSLALSLGAPLSIIEALIRCHPIHTLQMNRNSMLPLHTACMNGASLETVRMLLDQDMGVCAQALDAQKKSPLHYAVEYTCEPCERDIFGVIPATNLSKVHRSSEGSFMTMSEDMFINQIQVIKILTRAYPEMVNFTDADGNTPMDILHDCKADAGDGSKWERADICCEQLRKIAVQDYKEKKFMCEMKRLRIHSNSSNCSNTTKSTEYSSSSEMSCS
mmetsp:Transcript_4946/g.7273  ORF Transcript_4946/g.7273 Transcript_4946/m.7273 type:complete len:271 (+) Transcript_4946:113-925(+)